MFVNRNQTAFRTVLGSFGTALFAGACLFAAVAPAAADAAEAPRSTQVRYDDLNLANHQGRAVLDARIKIAARAVCSTGSGDIRARTEEARCIDTAVSKARSEGRFVETASRD